jgi:hypothetical protein
LKRQSTFTLVPPCWAALNFGKPLCGSALIGLQRFCQSCNKIAGWVAGGCRGSSVATKVKNVFLHRSGTPTKIIRTH